MRRWAARRDPVFPGHQVLRVLRREGWGQGETASRAPREAGGLFSVFAALNKQLYIPIEAEESLMGGMGTLLVSQGGKKPEEALKGLGDPNGFWRMFFTILADLCTVRNRACIRASNCLINSGAGAPWQVGGGEGGRLAWVLSEPAALGLGNHGCRSARSGGEIQAPRVLALAPSRLEPRGISTPLSLAATKRGFLVILSPGCYIHSLLPPGMGSSSPRSWLGSAHRLLSTAAAVYLSDSHSLNCAWGPGLELGPGEQRWVVAPPDQSSGSSEEGDCSGGGVLEHLAAYWRGGA